jgi:N-acyl-L-homoserine lactone synthetase
MSAELAQHGSDRALRVRDFLQQVDYRIASSEAERGSVFRLRYQAYLREKAIEPNSRERFSDAYDDAPNCWIFGVYSEERLISSIRVHVICPGARIGPALDVFPDIVGPMIDDGQTVVDPTRFAVDEAAARKFPDLPFLTLRVACMASEYFGADYCLATVRKEHGAFYRRIFKSEALSEPRPYPSLAQPICLLRADVKAVRDELMARYPVFLSSFTERRMLFERLDVEVAERRQRAVFVNPRAISVGGLA